MRVVVIGAGLQGVASAWFLASRGCEVTVLERGGAVACATSYANAGMLTPSMADPWNAPGVLGHVLRWLGREDAPFLLRLRALPSIFGWGLSFLRNAQPARFRANLEKNLRLASYSLNVLRELRSTLHLCYDERSNGTLKVFRGARAFAEAVQRNALLSSLGLDVRALDAAQATRIEPALAPVRDKLVGGIYCPQDESGDARAFTEALAHKATEAGATFVFDAPVDFLDRSGQVILAAVSRRGVYGADTFVLAAGSWSQDLLRSLHFDLSVRPVKGYSITVPFGDWASPPRMPVIDDALHAAATPLGQRLRVAGTAELAGDDTALTPSRIDNLFGLLLNLFPGYAPYLDRLHAAPWAGLRPVSADGVPLIGRYRCQNLFLNTGHGHLGWTLAAGSAKLLADLMLGAVPEIDARPYDAQRRV